MMGPRVITRARWLARVGEGWGWKRVGVRYSFTLAGEDLYQIQESEDREWWGLLRLQDLVLLPEWPKVAARP